MSELAAPFVSPRDQTLSVFSQVMGLVAITCLFAAGGAYLGKDLTGLWFLLPWIGAIACVFGLHFANARGARGLALTLLFAMGLLLGISIGNTINYYFQAYPEALYQAAGATGLFIGGFGAAGMAIRKDLSFLYRFLFFALLGLIVFGIFTIFVSIPGGSLIYAIAGLVIFAGYTIVDFNRLKRAGQGEVISLAAGIFLDIFNVFLFFLSIFGRSR